MQFILTDAYFNIKTQSQILYNDFQNYLTPIIQEVIITTESLPYQIWLDNTVTWLDIHTIHLLVTFGFLVMILINYWGYCNQQKIIDNQQEMINKFTDTESMEVFRLRAQVSKQSDMITKHNKDIERMEKTVQVYRALRHNTAGFFLLKGDPSNREFRYKMKELGSDKRYVSNREYMVKLKHLNKFDGGNITV